EPDAIAIAVFFHPRLWPDLARGLTRNLARDPALRARRRSLHADLAGGQHTAAVYVQCPAAICHWPHHSDHVFRRARTGRLLVSPPITALARCRAGCPVCFHRTEQYPGAGYSDLWCYPPR